MSGVPAGVTVLSAGSRRVLASPGFSLLAVAGLIYLNQVLFTVYVVRVHGGDPSFVARFLPAGWFDLATGSRPLLALAEVFPAPGLLAPTVLRVQAFLELPFVLFGYLTVCRWLDPRLYVRIARSPLIWLGSASYTATFCVVEWMLRNPYTLDDIGLRLAAALAAPLWIAWLARREPDLVQAEPSALTLLAFTASVWALGILVLLVYDTALLYNLGHLGQRLPGAIAALAVLAAARLVARLLQRRGRRGEPQTRPASLGCAATASSVWWFLALFFVIALPVRYAAAEPIAQAAGVVTILAAAAGGAAGVVSRARRPAHAAESSRRTIAAWAVQMSVAVAAGGAAAYAVLRWVDDI